ncbi:hypothetical protein GUITHDRAFT_149119 [Guillardia theta CCMP2712]|uniref:Solute-binding protein family 3/N-terminal domain-containing protein n=1 Tax=Guillardia theta (strain CCMP2712) TaxID=905079 RepID=L1I629_GUITC|nr:hypothetical protein GUITHDRAFT_149119 [Guillardia theta CCMP2712]EKX31723.1 hypothetical protein GUITHDRAFT_149119 [Guillardia theta CCMP2712]|eukprot:XP_005818703.1 hypothetical protein GUITHDRAFT_149119 [Guillardia theta CCMP2712]
MVFLFILFFLLILRSPQHAAQQGTLKELMKANKLKNEDVEELFFSVTPDLTASFAASAARRRLNMTSTVLWGGLEANVDGAPARCIRVLVHARSRMKQENVVFKYLRGAAALRSTGGATGPEDQGRGRGDAGTSALDAVRRRGTMLVVRAEAAASYPMGERCPPYDRSSCLGSEWGGSDVEMARLLAMDLGVQIEFVKTSWGQLILDMVNRSVFDIAVGGITDTLLRRRDVFFSESYAVTGKTTLWECSGRCGGRGPFETISSLNQPGVRVAVNAGGTNEAFVRKNVAGSSIVVVGQGEQPQALLSCKADVVVTDAIEADMMAMKHPELCAGNKTFTREGKAIMYALPRGDSSLKEYVDFWLRENAGRMEASFHKWMNLTVSG